jgi:hypothetical protein
MKDEPLKPSRRGFLKMAALGGGLPAIAGGREGQNFGPTLGSKVPSATHLAGAPSAPAGKGAQQLDRASLPNSLGRSASWIIPVRTMA